MAIEGKRRRPRQFGIRVVEVRPPRLHNADMLIREVRQGAAQEVARNDEIRIEHSNKLTSGMLESVGKRAAFEPLSIVSV